MSGRILMFARSLPLHRLGGMEQMTWDLGCAMAGQGAQIGLVTTSCPGHPARFNQSGMEVTALPGTAPGRYSGAWWAASRRHLLAQPPGEVAAVLSISAAGFGLLRLRQHFPATRFVMQAHGTSWDELRSKWRSGRPSAMLSSLHNLSWLPRDLAAYRRFDAVVAVGEAVREALARPPPSAVLPANRLRLIPNGVDTAIFRPDSESRAVTRRQHGIAGDAPIIVSAARLHPQKGGAAALAAFARYAGTTPAARYWIAGDGPEAAALRQRAATLGIGGRVSFLGRLTRAELARHLQAGDAFLHLGQRVEVGLPLNVLEALACGLPAVLSAHLAPVAMPGVLPVPPQAPALAAALLAEAVRPAPRQSLLPPRHDLRRCAQSYLTLLLPDRAA